MGKRADYEPMKLGNVRQHGMTQLDVSCHGPPLLASRRR
jgi:hypothetical protein